MAKQPKSQAIKRHRPHARAVSQRLFTLEEITSLLAWGRAACAVGDRAGALIVALLGTGGRRFEVAALRGTDVRQGAGGPEIFFPEVKGGGSATVPVSQDTYDALVTWVKKVCLPRGAPLIPTEGGEFMHPATLWRLFKQAVASAGIKREVGVHATRHAAGFLLLRATGDLTKVQAFLRHSSLTTTDGWYSHVHMPDLRAGLDKAGL